MWTELLRALALVLVIEGIMPFVAPERWRETVLRLASAHARQLRVFGGAMIGVGALLLHFLR